MSQLRLNNTSLSTPARLLCYLGPPSTVALTFLGSRKAGLLSPLTFVHTGWLYRQWREANAAEPERRGRLEYMVWMFAVSASLGLAAMSAIQLGAGYLFTTALFGNGESRTYFMKEFMRHSVKDLTPDELSRRAQLAYSWQNWAFNAAFSFGVAGLFEELLKYLPIAWFRRQRHEDDRKSRKYIDYAISSALGFSLVEGIGFIYASCLHGEESGATLLRTLLERLGLGSTGHILMAALTALRATRRDYYGERMSWWSVAGPSIALHGLFDFLALSFSASDGNVGWIHPTETTKTTLMLGMALSFLITDIVLVRREWRILQDNDRSRE